MANNDRATKASELVDAANNHSSLLEKVLMIL
jgi:hypothetical protein